MRGQHHALAALPQGKNPITDSIGGWVGPRAGLDDFGEGKNISPVPEFELRILQPVRYIKIELYIYIYIYIYQGSAHFP